MFKTLQTFQLIEFFWFLTRLLHFGSFPRVEVQVNTPKNEYVRVCYKMPTSDISVKNEVAMLTENLHFSIVFFTVVYR